MNQQARENVKSFLYKYKPFVIMIAMAVVFGIVNPTFIRITNLTNIFRQVATNAILAVGVSFVILTGGIDISVGSVLGFTGAVAVYLRCPGSEYNTCRACQPGFGRGYRMC